MLGLLLALAAGLASFHGARLVDPVVFEWGERYGDLWFDGDIPRTVRDMTARWADHHSANRHPLFPLATHLPVSALRMGLKLDPLTAVTAFNAVVAGVWAVALLGLLRSMGCRRLDALIFVALAMVSAFAVFWFVVPETFALGGVTIVCALVFVAAAQQRTVSQVWDVLISALTMSFTVTNWMAGLFATIVRHPWRRSIFISAQALCVVAALWAVEKTIYPRAASFLVWEPTRNEFFLAGSPVEVVRSFFVHSMIMPGFIVIQRASGWPMMTVHGSLPGSGTMWGAIAVPIWLAVLGLGMWGLSRAHTRSDLRAVLVLTLLGQLGLSMVYGRETFLYSPHFGPLLVVLAAFGTFTPGASPGPGPGGGPRGAGGAE